MRQPFAILAAIGLLSVLKSFLTFHEDVAAIINAYQVVTHYIWDFLFGWLYVYIPISVPELVKDYLTMGFICSCAEFRNNPKFYYNKPYKIFLQLLGNSIGWPGGVFFAVNAVLSTRFAQNYSDLEFINVSVDTVTKSSKMYLEFICWAIAIVCLSYGLLFADSIK